MSDARQRWIERLLRYLASGQTVDAFCAQESISIPRYVRHLGTDTLDYPERSCPPCTLCENPTVELLHSLLADEWAKRRQSLPNAA